MQNTVEPFVWQCPLQPQGEVHVCKPDRCHFKERLGVIGNRYRCVLTGRDMLVHPHQVSQHYNRRKAKNAHKRKFQEMERLQRLESELPPTAVHTLQHVRQRLVLGEHGSDEGGEQEHKEKGEAEPVIRHTRNAFYEREQAVMHMHHTVFTIFTCCGVGVMETAQLMSASWSLAQHCQVWWQNIQGMRTPQWVATHSQLNDSINKVYTREHHVLVVLFNTRTSRGLHIPRFPNDPHPVMALPASPFVQQHLPREKDLKERAQRLTSGRLNGQGEGMFVIENKAYTAARRLFHHLSTMFVQTSYTTQQQRSP